MVDPPPTHEDLLAQVIGFIRPMVPEGQPLAADTDLVSDLGFDSLKVMKLLEDVEDTYDISIPLNVLPDVRTVGDFAAQLERLLERS